MSDRALIAQHLASLFQTGEVPEELHNGVALRSPLDAHCCVQLRFQPLEQRWMLGVDRSMDRLDADVQAQWQENLLRVGHASRWESQHVGGLDATGLASLVDCDFPGTPQQAAEHATAQAIEGRLQALLNQLDMLRAPAYGAVAAEDAPFHAAGAGSSSAGTSLWLKA